MSEVIIVGGGLAGLFAALKLAPRPVTIITPRPLGEGASSAWAQAGVAAAIGMDDSPEKHAADTIKAGAGLCDEAIVNMIVREAPARIEDLLRYGVPFDRDEEGRLKLSREAAHSERRVVGVKGDQAGRSIMAALIAAARRRPSIRVLENISALDLAISDGRAIGVHAYATREPQPESFFLPASAIILATGGIGQLYEMTTNPLEARGDGLAMAARAGALIADAEFVQFHPTAIAIGKSPAPLATEALRGEGAWLINRRGERFMQGQHPDMELAPRDVVARAVAREVAAGRGAFLDCRTAVGESFAEHFPSVYAACREAGLDPARDPIPVAPAAHYHMGGVATDADARTSVAGLWAVGEAASTGLHGANRLASNSLLEAVVMAARAAEDISGQAASSGPVRKPVPPPSAARAAWLACDHHDGRSLVSAARQEKARAALQRLMTGYAGVERSGSGLLKALAEIERLAAAAPALENMTLVARLIITGAILRRESRGSHFRLDHSAADPRQARRAFLTGEEASRLSASLLAQAGLRHGRKAKRAAMIR